MSHVIEPPTGFSTQKKARTFDFTFNQAFFREHYATLLLLLIVALALFLRVFNLSTNPGGLNQDEASNGVDAFSLGQTLRDHHGNFLPVMLESFEDWPSPLITYLTIPFVWILGLTEFAVRLPAALFGTAAVPMMYFLVKQLTKRKDFALLASFLLAIMPWSVMTSRLGIPPAPVTFLLLLFVYAYCRASETVTPRPWKYVLVGLCAAALGYCYPTFKMFVPMLLGLLFLIDPATKLPWWATIKKFLVICATYLVLTAPFYLLVLMDPARYNARYNSVSIFREGIDPLTTFITRYLSYILPNFYFYQDSGVISDHVPGIEMVYNFLAPFYYMGVVLCVISLFSKKPFILSKRTSLLLLAWWVLFPVPASITMDQYNEMRILQGLPLMLIFAVVGLGVFLSLITPKRVLGLVYTAIVGLSLFYLAVFSLKYFGEYPRLSAEFYLYGAKQYTQYLVQNDTKFTSVKVDTQTTEPYISYLFYSGLDPARYNYAEINARVDGKGDWLYVPEYGKYTFDKITPEDLAGATEIYTVENYGRVYYRIYAKGTDWYVVRVLQDPLPEVIWS
ncbi:MAG: glycosyltransferase family 39 protein [Chloroflexi bacterium]|nr:glycosyltransferase family 39 protein [Chloroflexota bacterium]OJV91969.1 MAG: hypothetical protein BGO39_12740 [Chloroflexi bacterium 54-19]